MNRRQLLVQKQFLNNEKAVVDRLQYIYDQSLFEINSKIRNLEFDIGDLQEVYDWMDDDDPKKEIIKSRIQSKIYQKNYQQILSDQVGGILKQMQKDQYLTISDYLDVCYEDGFVGSLFDLHGQNVPMMMPIDQEAMTKAIQLDSKISEGLYTRLGEDVDVLKKRITSEVTRSIATGVSYDMVAQRLAGQTKIGFNKAVRIARTEGHRIQCSAANDAAHKARDRGADVMKQWDATLDGKTRPSHRAVDGEIRELDKPFSNGLDFPGDPDGGAAEVVNCRCAYLQRARWAIQGGFTKWNNFTGQLESFESPEAYEEFKKSFFSDENAKYMDYVQKMQDKYGTKNLAKLLDSMTEREYNHYSKLLANNPVYNVKAPVKHKPDYDCSMAKKFGKDHYDVMHDKVVNCTNTVAADVWKEYEADVNVANAHHRGGAYAMRDSIYLNVDNCAKGGSCHAPYETVFHEGGHAIDSIARGRITGGSWGARHYSSAYKDGIFPQTIKDEVQDYVKVLGDRIKAEFKAHSDDPQWFIDNGYMFRWETKIPKYSKSMAYGAFAKEVKNSGSMVVWGNLSDMLEGATLAKIQCGVGHGGATYWKDRTYDGIPDGLATEAFAEMMSATMTNPESLALIQKYLPKSYAIFQEMLESML